MPAFRLKLWGVRGSIPAPHTPTELEARIRALLAEFASKGTGASPADVDSFLASLPKSRVGGWGGNTVCVELACGETQAIIDAGSGLRMLGFELLAGPCGKGQGEVHLFFTHFHWDHLLGLPFFVPIFIPGNTIHVYSVQDGLPEVFQSVFRKPFFPVPLDKLGSRIVYHRLEPRVPFQHGPFSLTPYELDHPDPCWGYKVQCGGKTYSHCVDTECTRVSREDLGADLPLYQNVDLMVFDAQYTLVESIERVNWGHAAATIGLDVAMREGIKRVLFVHHDPASNDEKVASAEAQAIRYYNGQLKSARRAGHAITEVQWEFAREGMTIEL